MAMSTASKFHPFLSPPSNRGRVSPLFDELTHASVSPWNLTIDTAFDEREFSHDDECSYSSTSTLCAALGLSTTPKSPTSPSSPASCSSRSRFAPESPRYILNGTSPGSGNGSHHWYSETPTPLDSPKPCVEPVEPVQMGNNGPTVFVWDLDETLIIFQTLLDGRYVELFDGFKDNRKATFLGRRWERLILEVCDDYFFYNQVEEHNYANVHSLQEYDDGAELGDFNFGENLTQPLDANGLRKLSHLHRYACHLYDQGLETLLSPDQVIEWCDLYEETDSYTDGWLSAGRQKLEELQRLNEQALRDVTEQALQDVTEPVLQFRETVSSDEIDDPSTDLTAYNFLVTSGTLIPSLVKCLLFKLNPYFNPSNIFSSREDGKLQCCRWIRERFLHQDKFPKYCALGDGPDEREAARVLAWPFVKINTDPDSPDQLPQLSTKTVKQHMDAVYKNPDASSRAPLELSD